MTRISNSDTSQGRIRYTYRILIQIDNSSPINRMMDTIRANTEINNWVNQYRKIWNFNYKIDSNILFLETLNIVDKFKNTYNGKETKHYIIKSDKSSKKSQRRKK
jgi:hypothetical protein|tara:strand:+ start:1408 stop:1722 length:315 start_codon:yes stop_codon:yes gene_type:complete